MGTSHTTSRTRIICREDAKGVKVTQLLAHDHGSTGF